MTKLLSDAAENDDVDWAERSQHWLEASIADLPRRRLRQRNPAPLILCGHGISMRIENGALVIRDGFTHYPQQQSKYRFFPRDLELPTRILLLDGGGTLSFDVLSWLAEQGVALARVKWTGEVATVASGTGFASDRDKVQWQYDTANDPTRRLAYTIALIGRKLTASVATLETHFAWSVVRDRSIDKLRANLARIASGIPADTTAIRAIEGECAAAYFAAWQDLAIDWTATERRPVPDSWRVFGSRSSLANGVKPKNYNASHPVNAMLNYAYTVKLAHLQIQAIADGFDPTIGILHQGRRGKPAFVFDLIELERPKVDAAILTFIRSRKFAAADFVIRSDGACRLSPQLARMVATLIGQTNG